MKREGFDTLTANHGEEALKLVKEFSPAVIICDQVMPDITGIEVLKTASTIYPDATRILLTGHAKLETALEAINIGQVNQYILKPWNDRQLIKIVQSAVEKHKFQKENLFLQNLIQTQHNELTKTHSILQRELKLGARIHKLLLLGKIPKNIPGVVIDALSCPSREIDGDFYEFYQPYPHILDFVIGDVMGKGIAAALVGTSVKTHLLRFAMPFHKSHSFEKNTGWKGPLLKPEEIISRVHDEVVEQFIALEYFTSLLYGRFDLQYHTFRFVDCGSTKPIHFRQKENRAHFLQGDNFPLGVVSENHYTSNEIPFSEGDFFVFYSDGITEARACDGTLFGAEKLLKLIESNSDLKPSALIDLIQKALYIFNQQEKFDDDLTLVVIKIGRGGTPEVSKVLKGEFLADHSQLETVRKFVNQICRQAPGNSERLSEEMSLIINEAFCNIIEHGESRKPIQITAELKREGVTLEILDRGLPFDPENINGPNLTGSLDSGYGWHIIKELSNSLSYEKKKTLDECNRLKVFKSYHINEDKMQLSHETKNNILIITPQFDHLDAKDSPEFKNEVVGLIDNHKVQDVIFNLDKIQFIDSSGLGSFLSVLRILNQRGGDLKLSHMNKPVRTLFELVKMHKIFEIFNSTEDAVFSFRKDV